MIHSLSLEMKKKFLFFSTGSDRCPIKGLGNLNFVISRNGTDEDRLPSAHTCFNHLLLPECVAARTARRPPPAARAIRRRLRCVCSSRAATSRPRALRRRSRRREWGRRRRLSSDAPHGHKRCRPWRSPQPRARPRRYKGKERLLTQLLKAIKDTEGFHII